MLYASTSACVTPTFGDRIWLVTFMDYDLGYFDDETGRRGRMTAAVLVIGALLAGAAVWLLNRADAVSIVRTTIARGATSAVGVRKIRVYAFAGEECFGASDREPWL